MANEQEDKGFKVVDKRVATQASTESEKPKSTGPSEEKNRESVQGPGWEMHEERPESLPPIDFATFCLSLASSAMIHLGHAPHPETNKQERDIALAKQTIDILAVLEVKTRNNLTPEESQLLNSLLYDLRMRYVEAKK